MTLSCINIYLLSSELGFTRCELFVQTLLVYVMLCHLFGVLLLFPPLFVVTMDIRLSLLNKYFLLLIVSIERLHDVCKYSSCLCSKKEVATYRGYKYTHICTCCYNELSQNEPNDLLYSYAFK